MYIVQAYPTSSSNDEFDPTPELTQENTDLNLIFTSFTGMYLGQVNDPWFSAKDEMLLDNARPFLEKRYAPDEPINIVQSSTTSAIATISAQACLDSNKCKKLQSSMLS